MPKIQRKSILSRKIYAIVASIRGIGFKNRTFGDFLRAKRFEKPFLDRNDQGCGIISGDIGGGLLAEMIGDDLPLGAGPDEHEMRVTNGAQPAGGVEHGFNIMPQPHIAGIHHRQFADLALAAGKPVVGFGPGMEPGGIGPGMDDLQ
jgi:hypothetical protein